ncbi:sensor histidine kinase [Bryobacter aggregatus]|uniref:sensor histidine kinase n=1 Tax=Bryobacter aggregatus TaxID=360054 RepID=UPI0004E19DE4|nr:ATP-binding protein [Bryobacter aggregatus]
MATFKETPRQLGRQAFRIFGNLKIRPKLLILHNLFFLILTVAVYLSVIPVFEKRVASAKQREFTLLAQLFNDDAGIPALQQMGSYNYRHGDAATLAMPQAAIEFLDENPTRVWVSPGISDTIYKRSKIAGLFRAITIPELYYDGLVTRAKYTLLLVLGVLYLAAIFVLEFLIMPAYVYRPIQLFLDADAAARHENRERELIPVREILEDEIGQIMSSRNEIVTRLRQQNGELDAARRKLLEQDRLASLGLLSASVAHELNTPLAVLQGYIEKFAEESKSAQASERLARMLKMTQRLRRISESLVGFSRVRREQSEPIALRELIEEAWHMASIEEKASRVRFDNETKLEDYVVGNADRLLQVFLNLIRNALQAVPEQGGEIRIVTAHLKREGSAFLSIKVEDNGPGIPPEVLPEIFDAFVSTRLDSKGTGLGLTVSEGIIHQHGGTISAANRACGGASLEVRLLEPAAVASASS